MDYLLYDAEDFASDESYLSYYFKLRKEDVAFWEDWILHHPERLDIIINADQLISLLALHLPDKELQEEYERMRKAMTLAAPAAGEALPEGGEMLAAPAVGEALPVRRLRPWLAAAAILLLLVPAAYFIPFMKVMKTSRPAQPSLPIAVAGRLVEKRNTTSGTIDMTLEDGTLVSLQPGCKLIYPEHFPTDRREVYLEGSGTFTVGKSAQRPFYVYCENFVTHVLGTCFTIQANKDKKQWGVAVHSGKVEVYKRSPAGPDNELRAQNDDVILTPNQRTIYSEEDHRFETSLVEKPQPIRPDTVFHTTALSEIIHSFEKIYGIDIEVENDNINNCHFSGDLSHMDLYKQLDVICQSLNTSYEIIGTKILIRGKGCN